MTVPREEFSELTESLLRGGQALRLRAFGNSMYPTIRSGNLLWIEPCPEGPRLGEVFLFRNDQGRVIAHRIVEAISQNGKSLYRAKGDFLISSRDILTPDRILGKVTAVERDGQKITLHAKGFVLPFLFLEKMKRFSFKTLEAVQRLPFYPFLIRLAYFPLKIRYKISYEEDYEKDREFFSVLYFYPPYWRTKVHKYPGPQKTRVLAFMGKRPAGVVTLTHPGERIPPFTGWWIWGLYVRRRYQRLGIGRGLMESILAEAKKAGASKVEVLLFDDDQGVKRFYQKLGFKPFAEEAIRKRLDEMDKDRGCIRVPYQKIF